MWQIYLGGLMYDDPQRSYVEAKRRADWLERVYGVWAEVIQCGPVDSSRFEKKTRTDWRREGF